MRKISDDDIHKYNISMQGNPLREILGDKYLFYICGDSYRKLKDSENNWIKKVGTVFDEIISYLMDIGYEDGWIFLLMSGSSIGKEYANGDCEWQKKSEEWQMKKITFNRDYHTQRVKESKKKAFANVPDYMLDNPDSNNPQPELPDDHPLRDPYVLVNVDKELGLRIVHEQRNRLVIFICAISAFLCEKPLGAAGLGPSSVGKNMVFDTVLDHFPEKYPDDEKNTNAGYFLCNNLKEAALFRLDPKFINHTIVKLGETPDKPTDTYLELLGYLRQLQSEGKIAKTLSEQVIGENGLNNWTAKTLKLEAEVSFFATSIFGFEEQFGNRQIPLSFDESEAQTNRIAKWRAEIEKYGTRKYEVSLRKTKSEYIQKIIAGIDEIWYEQYKEYAFENPYANHVEYILQQLYSGSIQYRRVINYVFRFIETITRLHVFNRTVESTEFGKKTYRIIATSQDNLIGLYLLWPSLQQAIKYVTREDTDTFERMKEVFERGIEIKLVKNNIDEDDKGEKWFSANAMAKVLNKSPHNIRNSCKRLYKAGLLESRYHYSWFKYSISEDSVASVSIGPTVLLPFFLPADIPVCLLSMGGPEVYSMIGMYFPQLFSLFGSINTRVGTHYIRVQYLYYYIVYGSIDNFSSEIKEILAEDFNEKNTRKKEVSHTFETRPPSKRSTEGMAKLITEYRMPVRQARTLAKTISTKKRGTIAMLVEAVLMKYQKGNISFDGLEKDELVKEISSQGLDKTKQEIIDGIDLVLQKGDIYEPKPGYLRWMTDY